MARSRLLKTHKISFKRLGDCLDKPLINSYGEPVLPEIDSYIDTEGSLQPYSTMDRRKPTEYGEREEKYLIYYSKSELRTVEQVGNNIADTCEINGEKYIVDRKGAWQGYLMNVEHFEYYLKMIQPIGI